MRQFRYQLDNQKPRKKFSCPLCLSKKSFVRYRDTRTGEYLPEGYGKCERANNCTYYLNPYKDGFAKKVFDEEKEKNKSFFHPAYPAYATFFKPSAVPIKQKATTFIPFEVLCETLKDYEINHFSLYLKNNYGNEIACKSIEKYYLGSSNRWLGATTFPFIDYNRKVRAIQVKLFDQTLHTAKYTNKEGEVKACISYHEYTLKYNYENEGKELPVWLEDYFKNEIKVSCFFGEHLLNLPENKNKYIAIVEAPKTAIIADIYFNYHFNNSNFIWLAAGALDYLTEGRCNVLRGRKVVLYPDLNGFNKWTKKAAELSHIANFAVSDLLEKKIPEAEKNGQDLADYLLQIPFSLPPAKKDADSLAESDSKQKLIELALKLFEPERMYSDEEVVEKIQSDTKVTKARAEYGFLLMVECGAIEITMDSTLFYLGGSTPF